MLPYLNNNKKIAVVPVVLGVINVLYWREAIVVLILTTTGESSASACGNKDLVYTDISVRMQESRFICIRFIATDFV